MYIILLSMVITNLGKHCLEKQSTIIIYFNNELMVLNNDGLWAQLV